MEESGYGGQLAGAVQAHLSISQGVIQRMAASSASCKAWCVTLVSAILVIVADKGKPSYAFLAALPTLLFFVLDTYYLALERCFRRSYNSFVMRLQKGALEPPDLYVLTPTGSLLRSFFVSVVSFSIWPFYVMLAVMIWLTSRVVIAGQ